MEGAHRLTALGDLNGDHAADAVVATTFQFTGGSGHEAYAAVFVRRGDALRFLSAIPLDVKDVTQMAIRDGKARLDTLEPGPTDASCCPTKKGRLVVRVEGEHVITDDDGEPSKASAASEPDAAAPPPAPALVKRFEANTAIIRDALFVRPSEAILVVDLQTNEILDRFPTIVHYMESVRGAEGFKEEFYARLLDGGAGDLRYGPDPFLRLTELEVVRRLFGPEFPYSVRLSSLMLDHLVVVTYSKRTDGAPKRVRGVACGGVTAAKQQLRIAEEYNRLRDQGRTHPDAEMRAFLQSMKTSTAP